MSVREGRKVPFVEDFEVGDVYQHGHGRTITTTDNLWFSLITQNINPSHFDPQYAAQTEFGKLLVNSAFTIALVTGQSVSDVSQNATANLGWDNVNLPHPIFEGDTFYSQSEMYSKRKSKSRADVGIVTVRTTGYKQNFSVVITFKHTIMVYKRGLQPQVPRLVLEESA